MSEDELNNNGAARPTGKRQLSGDTTSTSSYEAKRVAPQPKSDDAPGGGIKSFFPEVVSEVRKVVWPTGRQMAIYTAVVFAFLIIMTALVSGVDALVGIGVEAALTP